MKSIENEANKKKLDYLIKNGRDGYDEFSARVDAEAGRGVGQLQKDFAFVAQSNEPTVLPEGEFQYLQQLAQRDSRTSAATAAAC